MHGFLQSFYNSHIPFEDGVVINNKKLELNP